MKKNNKVKKESKNFWYIINYDLKKRSKFNLLYSCVLIFIFGLFILCAYLFSIVIKWPGQYISEGYKDFQIISQPIFYVTLVILMIVIFFSFYINFWIISKVKEGKEKYLNSDKYIKLKREYMDKKLVTFSPDKLLKLKKQFIITKTEYKNAIKNQKKAK